MKKTKNLLKNTKNLLTNFKYFFRKNKKITLAVTIIIFSVFISLPLLSKPMLSEGDAYVRSYIAFEDFKNKSLFHSYGGTWLPFHKIVIGLPFYVYENYFLTPRLATLLINSASVYLLYITSLEIFRKNKYKKNLSIITSAIYLIFPQRIFLSTQTLTEPIFVFFLLLGIYFLIKNKLIGSSIFLNVSHGIRYESWFSIPMLAFYIIQNKKLSIKQKTAYISSLFIFPIYWFWINLQRNSSGFSFFSEKYQIAQSPVYIQEYWNFPLSLIAWTKNLFDLLGLSGIIFLLYGFFIYIKRNKANKNGILFISLSIYLFNLLVFQVFTGTMEWFPHRYLYIPIIFSFPFIALGLFDLVKSINKNSLIIYLSIFPLLLIDNFYIYQNIKKLSSQDVKYPIDREKDLNEVLRFYQQTNNNNDEVVYIYKNDMNLWLLPAFVYFNQTTESEINSIEVKELEKYNIKIDKNKNHYYIFEKPAFKTTNNFGEEIFSNRSFSVTSLKNEK